MVAKIFSTDHRRGETTADIEDFDHLDCSASPGSGTV
jgi:hypothetical protein